MTMSMSFLLSLIFAISVVFADFSRNNDRVNRNSNSNSNNDDKCASEHRHRRAWHTISQDERDLYIKAYLELNEKGIHQTFVRTHADDYALHQAHRNAAFGPWHRYYLWEFESAIRDLGGDYKCFSLPYWDFSYETEEENDVFKWNILNSGLGGTGNPTDDYCVTDGVFGKGNGFEPTLCWPGTTANNNGDCCLVRQACDIREVGCCTMASPAEMMDMIMSYDVYGLDNDMGPTPPENVVYGFNMLHEMRHGLGHDVIGGWVGATSTSLGHIANLSWSPDDPIFWLLHSYVDFNWALWQDCQDYDLVKEEDITLDIYGGTLDEPDGVNQLWGPSKIDVELRYPPLEQASWSRITKNKWTITPRDMHNLNRWDVSYDDGTFFEVAKVRRNCPNINNKWFYSDNSNRNVMRYNLNVEFSDDTYDILDERLGDRLGKSKKEIVHEWALMNCEYIKSTKKDECRTCRPPKYYDDCSDLPLNPKTKDIDVTLDDLLEKVAGIACMENTRRRHWNWAVQTHNKLGLCRGDFDVFCNKDFVHDNKPNKCTNYQRGSSGSSGSGGDSHSNSGRSTHHYNGNGYHHYTGSSEPLF